MSNIINPRAGCGFHVLPTTPALRLVLAYGTAAIEALLRNPAADAPGIYLSIRHTGYLGCSETSISGRAARLASASDVILAVVGGENRLLEGDAHALERIAFQALDYAGVPLRNRNHPEGAPVGLQRYAHLQRVWAETMSALREVAPSLACPWLGPDYLLAPADADEVEPLPTRWRGRMGEARATLRGCGTGYVVEAGSRIRLDPIASAPGLCRTMREELAFSGALVREPHCWLLTRDVHLPTLAACSRFVFTGGGSAYWHVDEGADAILVEPYFNPAFRR